MKAQLKQHNGTPTVFLDDQPIFFGCHLVGYMVPGEYEQTKPYAQRYGEAGIHIYSVDSLTHEWVGPRPDNPSHYDFTLDGLITTPDVLRMSATFNQRCGAGAPLNIPAWSQQ